MGESAPAVQDDLPVLRDAVVQDDRRRDDGVMRPFGENSGGTELHFDLAGPRDGGIGAIERAVRERARRLGQCDGGDSPRRCPWHVMEWTASSRRWSCVVHALVAPCRL